MLYPKTDMRMLLLFLRIYVFLRTREKGLLFGEERQTFLFVERGMILL